jgi:hypothetical protein
MGNDLEQIRAAVVAELRRQPAARSWSADAARLVMVNVGISLLLVAGIALVQEVYSGQLWRWLGAVLLFTIMVGGGVLAVFPGGQRLQLGMVALTCTAVPVLILGTTNADADASFFANSLCALAEVAVSLVPAVVTTLVLRRFSYQPRRALLGGLSAGATGVLVLHFTCDVDQWQHVLAFHVAPCVMVAMVLVWVRSRLASQTFAP